MKFFRTCSLLFSCALFLAACSVQKKIGKSAENILIKDSSLVNAHVGISIFDVDANSYLYNYQGDKYFVPASNTKIPTCYAAMKYLGDSIIGLEYIIHDSVFVFRGTGDPTLLHNDFKTQNVLDRLRIERRALAITEAKFTANRWGSGWGVGDISASYAPERNELPVYGNMLRIIRSGDSIITIPSGFRENLDRVSTNWQIQFQRQSLTENFFILSPANRNFTSQQVPFVTGGFMLPFVLLSDTLKKTILLSSESFSNTARWTKIYSQHTDSLLEPMMHRSDNFFAEQLLLMVSNNVFGVMSDAKIIDTILKTDFKDLPQKPRWADGSGLSRYNLFTPQDFVVILSKMKNEFGMDRIKEIFPTGGEGTLSSYYKTDSTFIYAKTGTLSGVVALSGFLYTRKNKLLIFSILVNNHNSSATGVRRAVEKYLQDIRNKH